MLDFFTAVSEKQIQELRLPSRLSLGGPIYWHLHRYFVQAALSPGDFSFLNLYEDTELSGYQLHRLKTELEAALTDLSSRSSSFLVLVGWNGEAKSLESEEWRTVRVADVRDTVQQLLSLASEAEEKGLSLFAVGD